MRRILRRHLAATEADAEAIHALSFVELIRIGWVRGLLVDEPAVWRGVRAARNDTSHAYDKHRADQVLDIVPHFLAEAQALVGALRAASAIE